MAISACGRYSECMRMFRLKLVQLQASIPVLVIFLLTSVPEILGAQSVGVGIAALRSMLQDNAAEIRIKAAEGLGRVGGREAVMILSEGLVDKNSEVRVAVVEALGFVGGSSAITVLSGALADKSAEVRLRAVEARKDAGTIAAIPSIQKAFQDKEESVRLRAALMLRKIGHRSGVPVLAQAILNDRSDNVRSTATRYLGSIGVKDGRSVGILTRALEDKSPAVRIRAVESLGFVQMPSAISALRRALEDPHLGVRIRATEVMGRVLAKDFE